MRSHVISELSAIISLSLSLILVSRILSPLFLFISADRSSYFVKNKILGSARDRYTGRQEQLTASKAPVREREREPVIDAPAGGVGGWAPLSPPQ